MTVLMKMMIVIVMVVITDDYDQDCTDVSDGYCIQLLNISSSDYIMMILIMRTVMMKMNIMIVRTDNYNQDCTDSDYNQIISHDDHDNDDDDFDRGIW